jgi:hypothetical protein
MLGDNGGCHTWQEVLLASSGQRPDPHQGWSGVDCPQY